MFFRTILSDLRQWATSEHRKPLVLRGARQVGKTTVVDCFGNEFDNYLSLNLERDNVKEIFEMPISLDDMVKLLFSRAGKIRKKGNTLIFIDEIQNSARAMSLLRYFYEDMPEVHVIAAGSLLENVVDLQNSFPVGRVEFMAMHPCSFREFLVALGKENLLEVMENPQYVQPFHAELMHLFNQYTIVGGMPEAVAQYAKKRDILAMDKVYESLVHAYVADIVKYVKHGKLSEVVRFVIETAWAKAGEIITLGNFNNSQYNARDVAEAFRTLQRSMLVELVYPTTATTVPVLPETKRMPKLLWIDTGLVNYQAHIRRDLIAANDILDVWRGHIAEQVVAQELLALNNKIGQKRGFWMKDKAAAEVDFLFEFDSRLVPIEVKNGHNSHLRSLHSFVDASQRNNVAVRVWSQPYSVDKVTTIIGQKPFTLLNVPFYMVGNLPKLLGNVL